MKSGIVIIILLVLSVSSFFLLFRSNIFIIKTIEVELQKIVCADSNQISSSSKLLGQNLILINSSKVEKELKEKYLCIKGIAISKHFPNKIKLHIFERVPAAILISLKSEQATGSATLEKIIEATGAANLDIIGPTESFLVDSEGIVYQQNIDQINVPKIYLEQYSLVVGQKIEEDLIKNLLKILEKVKSFGVMVKEAKIYSKFNLLINATPKIVFKLNKNLDIQLASLQLILGQAKIDQEDLEFIDLRFDKPVIRLAPKKKNG